MSSSFWTYAIEKVSLFCDKMKQWTLTDVCTFNSFEMRNGKAFSMKRHQRNEYTLKTIYLYTFIFENGYGFFLYQFWTMLTPAKNSIGSYGKEETNVLSRKWRREEKTTSLQTFLLLFLFWSSVFPHSYATIQHWFP